jgi:hypothetical protein
VAVHLVISVSVFLAPIVDVKNIWTVVIIPIGILVIISQLGGITVLVGAGLFAANRVNLGKLLVGIGTGQGLFTIALRVIYDRSSVNSSLEWRRSKVRELASQGYNQSEISKILQISRPTITRDIQYLSNCAKENIKKYINES